jgi:amino acid permease
MASTGILPGLISCAVCGFLGAFGLYLLSVSGSKTPYRRASFFAVADLTFPPAAVFLDLAIAIKCFGVSIRYAFVYLSSTCPHGLMSFTATSSS